MGITERHWFEDEEPELTEQQLEDAISMQDMAYKRGFHKGYEVGMSMEFVNRICPNCKNPNYMVFLGDFSKAYKYKCMNCNRYFNDIDFEKEPPQPVWKVECANTKVDMVEVVRCKYCKKRNQHHECEYGYHSDDWFCADGKRKSADEILMEEMDADPLG